ncbi:MAG: glycosyltransferase family 4 protein [Actinomycetota bacterium]
MHILILTDRDWGHPEAGGTGVHLTGQVDHWLEWGHSVTVIAGGYEGAPSCEREKNLTVYRLGSRVSVFPATVIRGLVDRIPAADVTLEIINGICWMTPIWLKGPRVSLIHHVHKSMYVDEMGRKGKIAAFALETLPLRTIYRRSRFLVVSEATKAEVERTHSIPGSSIDVVYPGVDSDFFKPSVKSEKPTIVFLGRLKAYKRIERLIDVISEVDEVTLDVIGDGDHGDELRNLVRGRGLDERVRFHGHVNDERKRSLLSRSWIAATASSAEGWSSATLEAAACGTPSVAHPVGGLKESIVHEQTGVHAADHDAFVKAVRRLTSDDDFRERLSVQARARAEVLGWERSARGTLEVLAAAAAGRPAGGVKGSATTVTPGVDSVSVQ